MPSLREEYETVLAQLTHLGPQENRVQTLEAIERELDVLDYKLHHARLPPDERVELGKLSAEARDRRGRLLHDLQHPTILSPRTPGRPERGWSLDR
ncbi:hypothetical protein C5E51_34360 [Nocardia nova]|uniref:hypothetical protein n=1 Tax=Nocardia nova TaxID=37330 RepID=UPI000CE9C0A9|nr:hypothetical protein [Nocardia nova]PPJ01201.1 hypothetical protein C5E51_34360 [Nocardia nova]